MWAGCKGNPCIATISPKESRPALLLVIRDGVVEMLMGNIGAGEGRWASTPISTDLLKMADEYIRHSLALGGYPQRYRRQCR